MGRSSRELWTYVLVCVQVSHLITLTHIGSHLNADAKKPRRRPRLRYNILRFDQPRYLLNGNSLRSTYWRTGRITALPKSLSRIFFSFLICPVIWIAPDPFFME